MALYFTTLRAYTPVVCIFPSRVDLYVKELFGWLRIVMLSSLPNTTIGPWEQGWCHHKSWGGGHASPIFFKF